MFLLTLVFKSLWNRRFTTVLTLFSLAVSIALLIAVERTRAGARESFAGTISQTDLIVGGRGGSLQLLLYTVFRLGNATNNVSYKSYQEISKLPEVAWTIPYSLGDSHRSFRVVATDKNFYEHYSYQGSQQIEFAKGNRADGIFDVVLGWDVANKLLYDLGDKVILTHGAAEGPSALQHADKPFHVVGILAKTNTPIDKSLYITLEGMEAIHMGWNNGEPGEKQKSFSKEQIQIGQITSFLLRAHSRLEVLGLQRNINEYRTEPLMAIIPGVAMSELWSTISYAETALQVVSFFVILVGLVGMLIALYTALDARRREMAILRAVGAGTRAIIALLTLEAFALSTGGCFLGIALAYAILFVSRPVVESQLGIVLPISFLSLLEWTYLAVFIFAGSVLGLIPSWRAVQNSLADGLAVRF